MSKYMEQRKPGERRQARSIRDTHDRYRLDETSRRRYDRDVRDRRSYRQGRRSRSRSPDYSKDREGWKSSGRRVESNNDPLSRRQRNNQLETTLRDQKYTATKSTDGDDDTHRKGTNLIGSSKEDSDQGDEPEAAMEQLMGFKSFGSTHEKHVSGNHEGAIKKSKPARYRQYMNRNGGFNRELSPS